MIQLLSLSRFQNIFKMDFKLFQLLLPKKGKLRYYLKTMFSWKGFKKAYLFKVPENAQRTIFDQGNLHVLPNSLRYPLWKSAIISNLDVFGIPQAWARNYFLKHFKIMKITRTVGAALSGAYVNISSSNILMRRIHSTFILHLQRYTEKRNQRKILFIVRTKT